MHREMSSEFGYDIKSDTASARKLERILQDARVPDAYDALHDAIAGNVAFVVGAGPSLAGAFDTLARYSDTATIISADTAVKHLVGRGIMPRAIVSDLDGHIQSHIAASDNGAIMVIHAHADNEHLLYHAGRFATCVGTTQTEPFGRIYNLGGFTDGDRAIFAADHFGASHIVLFGMDFGGGIGAYSDTAYEDRPVKMRKMQVGRRLVEEWIVGTSESRLLATSDSGIRGFEKITYGQVSDMMLE